MPFPRPGRPQEIIDRLVEDCDLFVCLFHKRLGTPSGKEESGTLEEFLLAYDTWREWKKPHIMLYFKDVQVKSPAEFNDPQLKKVFDLRGRVEEDKLALFDTFGAADEFRVKLTRHIKEWLAKKEKRRSTKTRATQMKGKKVVLDIPSGYRTSIADRCRYMDIDKLREKSDVIMVELPEIFVPLYANPPEKAETKRRAKQPTGTEERSEPNDLEELAAAYDQYVSLKIMAQAMNGTKGTDTEKLIAYLESQPEFDLLKARKGYFRSWDHQLIQEAYPFTVKPKGQAKDKWDFLASGAAVPAANQPLKVINPPKSQNACVF